MSHNVFSLENGRYPKTLSLVWSYCLPECLHVQTKNHKEIKPARYCDFSTTKHVQTCTQHTCTHIIRVLHEMATQQFAISKTIKGSENKVTFSPVLLLMSHEKPNSSSRLRKTLDNIASFSQVNQDSSGRGWRRIQ